MELSMSNKLAIQESPDLQAWLFYQAVKNRAERDDIFRESLAGALEFTPKKIPANEMKFTKNFILKSAKYLKDGNKLHVKFSQNEDLAKEDVTAYADTPEEYAEERMKALESSQLASEFTQKIMDSPNQFDGMITDMSEDSQIELEGRLMTAVIALSTVDKIVDKTLSKLEVEKDIDAPTPFNTRPSPFST